MLGAPPHLAPILPHPRRHNRHEFPVPAPSTLKTLLHGKQTSLLVKLTIHELTNVPLVNGSFSVEWKFRGGKSGELGLKEQEPSTQSSSHLSPLHPSPSRPQDDLHRSVSSTSLAQTFTTSPRHSTDPSHANPHSANYLQGGNFRDRAPLHRAVSSDSGLRNEISRGGERSGAGTPLGSTPKMKRQPIPEEGGAGGGGGVHESASSFTIRPGQNDSPPSKGTVKSRAVEGGPANVARKMSVFDGRTTPDGLVRDTNTLSFPVPPPKEGRAAKGRGMISEEGKLVGARGEEGEGELVPGQTHRGGDDEGGVRRGLYREKSMSMPTPPKSKDYVKGRDMAQPNNLLAPSSSTSPSKQPSQPSSISTRSSAPSRTASTSSLRSTTSALGMTVDKDIQTTLNALPSNVVDNPPEPGLIITPMAEKGDGLSNAGKEGSKLFPSVDGDGSSIRRGRAGTEGKVAHILLHKGENSSHTSLASSLHLGFGKKKSREKSKGEEGDVAGGSGMSTPGSMFPKGADSKSTKSGNSGEVATSVHLEKGTILRRKGRTPIQELDEHTTSWEWDVAQAIKVRIRPLDDEAKRYLTEPERTGKNSIGVSPYLKGYGFGHLGAPQPKGTPFNGTPGVGTPYAGTPGGSTTHLPLPSMSGVKPHNLLTHALFEHEPKQGKGKGKGKGKETEIAGWLGGGPHSESGLKIVVYQHVAGLGLHPSKSHGTIGSHSSDENMDEDLGLSMGIGARIKNKIHETAHRTDDPPPSTSDSPYQRSRKQSLASQASQADRQAMMQADGTQNDPGTFFGMLNLDLAEYATEGGKMGKGGVTRRYLLKGGKTNAMIKLTIEVELIGGESLYIAPPLQRGHEVAGLVSLAEKDAMIEQHIGRVAATKGGSTSPSSSSASLPLRGPSGESSKQVSPSPSEANLLRPAKPPDSHFIQPDKGRFDQFRRTQQSSGQRAVYAALRRSQHGGLHHQGGHTTDLSAEQVIEQIFNPMPVDRPDKVSPFTYLVAAPLISPAHSAKSTIYGDAPEGAEAENNPQTEEKHEKHKSGGFMSALAANHWHHLEKNHNKIAAGTPRLGTPDSSKLHDYFTLHHGNRGKAMGTATPGSGVDTPEGEGVGAVGAGASRPRWLKAKSRLHEVHQSNSPAPTAA